MDFGAAFLIDRMIQEEGLYVHNMHNTVEQHFSISIAPVRSRGDSLVILLNELFIRIEKQIITCSLSIIV
jgi:hypothetical protein